MIGRRADRAGADVIVIDTAHATHPLLAVNS
jgi:hypothetical protein